MEDKYAQKPKLWCECGREDNIKHNPSKQTDKTISHTRNTERYTRSPWTGLPAAKINHYSP